MKLKHTLLAVALAGAIALTTGCAGQDAKPAGTIADICGAANAAKPFADVALVLPQTSAKAKTDIIAAEAVLWSTAPGGFRCDANPLPTSLTSEQIAGLVVAGIELAEAIKAK